MTFIAKLLPAGVVSAEHIGSHFGTLLPEELAVLGRGAVQKRREEFAAGRTLARNALKSFGIPESPILCGPSREPLWPDGFIGSITHCEGYCAAVIGENASILSIGIDAEQNEPLPKDVLNIIAVEAERRWLDVAPRSLVNWDKLIFSIKESVFKTWYPVNRTWLGFEDACVQVYPERKEFEVTLLPKCSLGRPSVLSSLRGRYLVQGELLLTAIVVLQSI
jgi:4'-phosphopantetheinyl transferase EntD